MTKLQVAVAYSVDADGNIFPRLIKWQDGREWVITRVIHTCRCPYSDNLRFTVLVAGQQKYLYYDDVNWYVTSA